MRFFFAVLFVISIISTCFIGYLVITASKSTMGNLKKYLLVSSLILLISALGTIFIQPAASSFGELVKITSHKSDTGGFDTDNSGNFTLKGVALRKTTIVLKDDLDDDYPVKTKHLKKNEHFSFQFHLNKKEDVINLTLHIKDGKRKFKKDIDIFNDSDAYNKYADEQFEKDEKAEKESKTKKNTDSSSESQIASSSSESKSNSSEVTKTPTNYDSLKISKSVKGSTFSGANIRNDVLTFIIKDDQAYTGIGGFKLEQKQLLREIEQTIQTYRSNPLASNGMIFTGARYELDDGSRSPVITLYFDSNSLSTMPDFSMKSADYAKEYDDPTRLLDYATNHYIDGMFLKNVIKSKGIYENKKLIKNGDETPDWIIDIESGETLTKPLK
ncbi:hypothetical protein CG419_03745 [Latilactobacillus curvatus]|uniref:Uncharacterized protein n=1 Tax=Latilactobacillus curvatus TaxID=28038 RepID=A0AAC9UMD0_LATCU|nr:hypothetical protein [Latilactobacillus curvatus]ASN59788.1 hypothetical protein CG419_03745 [Latilactobacillus curvatus]